MDAQYPIEIIEDASVSPPNLGCALGVQPSRHSNASLGRKMQKRPAIRSLWDR